MVEYIICDRSLEGMPCAYLFMTSQRLKTWSVKYDLHQVSENMISTTSVQEKAAEESVLTMY